MHYKTITMNLLETNHEDYQSLCRSRQLLNTINRLAAELRADHLATILLLRDAHPGLDSYLIESQALELAVAHLQERLSSSVCDIVAAPSHSFPFRSPTF